LVCLILFFLHASTFALQIIVERLLRVGDDFGDTWSGPVRLNSNTSEASRVMSNIIVNNYGVILVSWVDDLNNEGNCYNIFASTSFDGGSTILPEVLITPEVSCLEFEHNGGGIKTLREKISQPVIKLQNLNIKI
jgi:hypothetical protein